MSKKFTIVIALFVMLYSPIKAQSNDEIRNRNIGVRAYNSGDYETALKQFKPLAEKGYALAQKNMGVLYKQGHGVIQDYKEAYKWFRLAADQGDANAQHNLGNLHSKGLGVHQDNILAYMWHSIGSTNANGLTDYFKNNLAKQMTPADISKAQTMARECMSSGYTKCGY